MGKREMNIQSTSEIYTRLGYNLHLPSVNLTMVQKGVFYSGCKIFNSLPIQIRNQSSNQKLFKKKLKSFLIEHSLYGIDEFYQIRSQ